MVPSSAHVGPASIQRLGVVVPDSHPVGVVLVVPCTLVGAPILDMPVVVVVWI